MSLNDHYDENMGGNFIPPGEHVVRIVNSRTFQYNSGSDGVEFTMRDAQKREIRHSFCMHDNSLKILAYFAKVHCGLSEEEMRHYNTDNPASHRQLVGKYLKVTVEKLASQKDASKKFSEITQFERCDGPEEAGNIASEQDQPQPAAAAVPGGYQNDDEDIPF